MGSHLSAGWEQILVFEIPLRGVAKPVADLEAILTDGEGTVDWEV